MQAGQRHTEGVDSSLFYRPGALLSHPELCAARLDGLLVELGDGYIPADLPDDAGARAAAIRHILPPGYAASGPTAAWVHGVADSPPSNHHLQRAADRRPRIERRSGVTVHETRLPPADLLHIGRVPVTTLRRTLSDLVLASSRDRECAAWMRAVALAHPELVRQVQTALTARSRLPGKRAALAAIAELQREMEADSARQDDVTRYTS